MQNIIVFTAVLATAIAAPLNLEYNMYVPLSKSTLTSSSQVVDHGSTHVLHAPVLAHEVEYHVPLAKSTLTKSSHVVNHGSTTVVHTPVSHAVIAHAPVSHAVVAPVSHALVAHAPVYSVSSPVLYKAPDSAISHQSSSTYNSVPVYAFH
ncbi:unnamed protein product, partial [Brenthis ino]